MLYTLMHREQPVAVLDMNPTNGSINGVKEILAAEHLPIQVRHDNLFIVGDLDKWFSGRAIPASRSGFRQNLEDLELQRGIELSSGKLLMECCGLSLSDQYWVSPVDAPLNWKKINFYDNPFSEDVGNFLFGQIVEHGMLDLVSPCNTSDGWLKKKWKIIDGQRVLIKGGSGVFSQEPFKAPSKTKIVIRHCPGFARRYEECHHRSYAAAAAGNPAFPWQSVPQHKAEPLVFLRPTRPRSEPGPAGSSTEPGRCIHSSSQQITLFLLQFPG